MTAVTSRANPWRYGFTDSIMDRPCSSPWKDARQYAYMKGWWAGEADKRRNTGLQKGDL